MDMGIVNAGEMPIYADIPQPMRDYCEAVILNQSEDGQHVERLLEFAESEKARTVRPPTPPHPSITLPDERTLSPPHSRASTLPHYDMITRNCTRPLINVYVHLGQRRRRQGGQGGCRVAIEASQGASDLLTRQGTVVVV